MERADAVPGLGVGGEIARRRLGAVGANRLEPSRVTVEQGAGLAARILLDRREQRFGTVGVGQLQEYPAALLAPRDQPGIAEDADMA